MIDILKFAHILFALGLLGLTAYCLSLTNTKHRICINKNLLIIGFFALVTGSLLVYPKHFTFHTPWIQAAYLLIIMYGIIVGLSIKFSNKITQVWKWRSLYMTLLTILVIVVHDAVTKQTFLIPG